MENNVEMLPDNMEIYMVQISFLENGNPEDPRDYPFMDEHDRKDGCIYMSMYRSEEDAEKGFSRYCEVLKGKFKEIIKIKNGLVSLGFDKNYRQLFEEFLEVSGVDESDGFENFDDVLPYCHKITKTDVGTLRKAFKGFTNPHFED